jgi:aryl-alcohol dehydrogenase-like predicted oxidoreductase
VAFVIVGASSVEQLRKNLRAREDVIFTTDELEMINAILR